MTEERANRKKSRFNVFRRRKNDDTEARFEGTTIEATASERPLFQTQERQGDSNQNYHREANLSRPESVGNNPENRPAHQDPADQEKTQRKGLMRALLGRGEKQGELENIQSTRPVFAQRSNSQTSNQEAQKVENSDDVRLVSPTGSGPNADQQSLDGLPQMPPLRRTSQPPAQSASTTRVDSLRVSTSETNASQKTTDTRGPMFTQRTKPIEAASKATGLRATGSAERSSTDATMPIQQPVTTPRQPIAPERREALTKETGQSLFRSQSSSDAGKPRQNTPVEADRPAFATRPSERTPIAPPVTGPRPTPLPRPEPGNLTGTRIPAQSGEQPATAAKSNQTNQNDSNGISERPAVPTAAPKQATAPKDSAAPKPPASASPKSIGKGSGPLTESVSKSKDEKMAPIADRPKVKPPMPPKKPAAPTPPPAHTVPSNPSDSNINMLEQKPMPDLPDPSATTQLTPPSRLTPSGSVSLGIADQGQLIVGKDIELNGKVQNCDVLIIEGTVEATLVNTKVLEVAEGGVFRGTAPVETAEISGLVEGDLIVDGHVLVRSTGVVNGNIEFGELEIERGGRVHGSMVQFGTAEQKAARHEKDSAASAPKKKAAKAASKKERS